MNKLIVVVAEVLVLCLLGGCASKPTGHFNIEKRFITILTEPEGAEVVQIKPLGQPSANLGITPIVEQPVIVIKEITKLNHMPYSETEMLFKHVGNLYVVIGKKGYHSYKGYLKTDSEKTLTHEITLQPEQ